MTPPPQMPRNLKLFSVFSQSVSIFWRNFCMLLSLAVAIDFVFLQLVGNVQQWSADRLDYNISFVVPLLTISATTIFLTFAFLRLAIDTLEPSSSARVEVWWFKRFSKLIWPQDERQWKCLGRVSVITVANWVVVALGLVITFFVVRLVSWLNQTLMPAAFWITVVLVGIISLYLATMISLVGVRIWFAIPMVVVEDVTIWPAIRKSWHMTATYVNKLYFLTSIILTSVVFLLVPFLTTFLVLALLVTGVSETAVETLARIFSDAMSAGFATTLTVVCFYRVKELQTTTV